jgi:prepilin-type processing-associated H-X9-DG protein
LSDQPTQTLSYAAAVRSPVSVDRLLRQAQGSLIAGLIFPLFAIGAVISGVLAYRRTTDDSPNHRRAKRWIAAGAIFTIITPAVYIAIFAWFVTLAAAQGSKIKCASNLRQIGMAIRMYADQNADLLASDFATIAATQDITADVFICPHAHSDNSVRPTPPTQAQMAATIAQGSPTCSFFMHPWPGRTLGSLPPNAILAYEKPTNHDDGMNFLFADGHVDWHPAPLSNTILAELAAGTNPPPSLNGAP